LFTTHKSNILLVKLLGQEEIEIDRNMSYPNSNPLFRLGQNPWIMLLVLVLISLGGVFLIGQVMAIVTALIMLGSLSQLQDILLNPEAYPDHRSTVLIMQGMSSLGGFIITPIIYYYLMVKGNLLGDFVKLPSNAFRILIVTVVMVFSFMVVNTVFIEWNANLELPGFMSGFEKWATDLEDSMAGLTKFLTEFETTGYFILSIVVIAVIPGIGEEILFRGFLQNILRKIFRNDHVAVWVAAILFSAIHFQFYGFVPRMLLGAIFGYLYLWSGNLLVPIVAHFLNNSISLLSLFVYQKGLTDFDAESTEALPMMYVLIFSALFVAALVYFKNFTVKNENDEGLERSV
jgi:membrane protease YdiL (CAAX protease family)